MTVVDPTLVFEWELAGVWTDIGSPMLASFKRGREHALDHATPGVATVVMEDSFRSYDPDYNAVFTALRPGSHFRLRAVWATVSYPLFDGYLERMFYTTSGPHSGNAIFELVDGLSKLANANLASPFEQTVRSLNPRAWLRLNERKGPYALDSTRTARGVYLYAPDFAQTGLIDPESDSAVRFPAGGTGGLIQSLDSSARGSAWSVSFALNYPTIPAFYNTIMRDYRRDSTRDGLEIGVNTSGHLVVTFYAVGGAVLSSVETSINITGNTYLFTIVAGVASTLAIYIGDTDWSSAAVGTSHTLTEGAWIWSAPTVAYTLDELQVYDYALSPAQLTTLNDASNEWLSDTVAHRVIRLLDASGWPAGAGARQITTEQDDVLGKMVPANALDYLNSLEGTIEGRLWVRPNGQLVLMGRNEFLDYSSDSSLVLDDAGTAPGYLSYSRYVPFDWSNITNVITRTNGDDSVIVQDAASIASYQRRDNTTPARVESRYLTLVAEQDLALYRLDHFKDPVARIEGLRVMPAKVTSSWPAVLGLDLNSRMTWKRTPQGIPPQITFDAIVEGIEWNITPKHWVLLLNVDATYARRYFLFDTTLWDSPDWRFSA